MNTIVLAFSGGLDTSFCAAWLAEETGARIISVCVDTGGFSAEGLAAVAARARSLGVAEHHTVDARDEVYEQYVAYLIKGHVLRGGTYPVSVAAERTAQATAVVEVAHSVGADAVAHGSTGAGNDQVRFDVAFGALAPELKILAPVRELNWSREQEAEWLSERGFDVLPPGTRESPECMEAVRERSCHVQMDFRGQLAEVVPTAPWGSG